MKYTLFLTLSILLLVSGCNLLQGGSASEDGITLNEQGLPLNYEKSYLAALETEQDPKKQKQLMAKANTEKLDAHLPAELAFMETELHNKPADAKSPAFSLLDQEASWFRVYSTASGQLPKYATIRFSTEMSQAEIVAAIRQHFDKEKQPIVEWKRTQQCNGWTGKAPMKPNSDSEFWFEVPFDKLLVQVKSRTDPDAQGAMHTVWVVFCAKFP